VLLRLIKHLYPLECQRQDDIVSYRTHVDNEQQEDKASETGQLSDVQYAPRQRQLGLGCEASAMTGSRGECRARREIVYFS
jgi:hypothetical protein